MCGYKNWQQIGKISLKYT